MIVTGGRSVRVEARGRRRGGVTLVEVMLVLAVLVLIASITWPALDGPISNQRLRKSADIVRTEWSRARIHAMNSGDTYVFRYQLSEGVYKIETYAGAEGTSGGIWGEGLTVGGVAYVPSTVTTTGGTVAQPGETGALSIEEKSLPEKVVFAGDDAAYDTRAEMVTSDESTTSQLNEGWSQPILFHPDGTTSDVHLILKSDLDSCIELTLRGLTGIVTLSEVFPASEYQGDINIDAAYYREDSY